MLTTLHPSQQTRRTGCETKRRVQYKHRGSLEDHINQGFLVQLISNYLEDLTGGAE